jgi:Cys-tRNA(Pro)/Cys-tRNA(Cys) deacylase
MNQIFVARGLYQMNRAFFKGNTLPPSTSPDRIYPFNRREVFFVSDTPVTRALSQMGVPFRLFRHAGPVHSLAQAARERGQQPEQVVRSIVFRVAKDEYVMVLMAGARQVSWPALRHHLGQSRLTMASEKELLTTTGYPIGAVSPFGLPKPMRVLADESVFAPDEISIGSGERGLTVIMRAEDLRRALGAVEVKQFAETGGVVRS